MRRIYLLLVAVATVIASFAQGSVFVPVDKNLYPNNMTMVVRLMDGDAVVNHAEVAAFIGGECRGVASATNGLYYLVITGEGAGQHMSLRTHLDGEIVIIDNTQQFVSDNNIGASWEPYVIDLQNRNIVITKGDANDDGEINIADVIATVNDIQGTTSAAILKDAADVDGNGVIDATDVAAIIGIMQTKE